MKFAFIVGPHACGKSYTINKKYNQNESIEIIDTGPIIRNIHENENPSITLEEWINEKKRVMGESATNIIIRNEIKKIIEQTNKDNYIIIGFRTLEGIYSIINDLNIENYNILYIDSPKNVLYENYLNREKTNISYEQFLNYLQNEETIGLLDMKNKIKSGLNYTNYYMKKDKEDIEYITSYLDRYLFNKKIVKNLNVDYIWPVEPKYIVLQHDKYGIREKHMILGKARFHSGFDITTETMTPVKASSSGIVVASGLDEKIISGSAKWNERYGNKVEILDEDGRRLVYAHLRETLVNIGEYVKQGETIGLSGCSGGSRIPHLHFEIRNINTNHSGKENTVNPLIILPKFNFDNLTMHFSEEPYGEIWERFLTEPWGLSDNDIPYSQNKELIR